MMRASGGAVGRAVWGALLLLVLARAVTAFVPSMWAWGVNLQRFLRPLLAWGPCLLMALPLVPRFARAPAQGCERIGDLLITRGAPPWIAALARGPPVSILPDRNRLHGGGLRPQCAVD